MVFHINKLVTICLLLLAAEMAFGQAQEMFLIQGEKKIALNNEESVKLKKEPFTIRFHSPRYSEDTANALQVAAFRDKAWLDKAYPGIALSAVPYLSPGSGMAAYPEGYPYIMLNPEGHHYLYYFDERDKRVDIAGQQGDWLTLDWTVEAFLIDGERKLFRDAGVAEFYLVLFFDANHNRRIDEGELKKLSLTFL
ncbi:hypothetical protein [Taibaiella helva]|uniref:hypothetical protein n=1 Tax=Taibaiella helva TaxID=2301235 RepID=UPI001300394C|nr:hypothetical protein [Taibaiella helva]